MDLRPLHPLAARQRDLLRREDLTLAGAPSSSIDDAVRRGRLHAVLPGVLSLGVHRDRADLWLAAVLACGPGALLSHGSAAALWGFGPERMADVEVSAARSRVRVRGVLLHRPRSGRPATTWRGVPVTTPLATLVDLADVLPFDALLRCAMEADHQRRADLSRLRPVPGRRGHGRVLRLLEYVAEGSASEFEHLTRELFTDLPPFEGNVRVHGRKLDCVWREHRVALECDSYRFHRERRKFESDRRAPLELSLKGWRVVRITWRQLRLEPELVRAAVVEELRRGGWAA